MASSESDQIHHGIIVIDAHADIELPDKPSAYCGRDGHSKVTPNKMARGGVDCTVMAVAVGPGRRNDAGVASARRLADRKLAAALDLVAEDPAVDLARSAADVRRAHAANRRSIMLGWQNTQMVGTDLDAIADFHSAGCRIFALTHIGHNEFADSSRPNFDSTTGQHEPREEHGGLSALGREAVKRINGFGGVLDVSQLSENATLQVLDISDAPVIASHSNARSRCDVSRNLSDREIDGIAALSGVVCVTPFLGYLFDSTDEVLVANVRSARVAAGLPAEYLYPFELYWELPDPEERNDFLRTVRGHLGKATVETMVDHLDHIVERVGIEHVGIGTDFNHGGGISGYQEAHDAPNVTHALVARGYSSGAIASIWGENLLRVVDAVA
ncbi:MAG: membrane dipeptidase [Acidimicrobiales bacterium]|nr:membrane dipeptidase [Acidimicrobiales bacterium]